MRAGGTRGTRCAAGSTEKSFGHREAWPRGRPEGERRAAAPDPVGVGDDAGWDGGVHMLRVTELKFLSVADVL